MVNEIVKEPRGYKSRIAQSAVDLRKVQALRRLAFADATPSSIAWDDYDERASHILVEAGAGKLFASCRARVFQTPGALADSYSGRYYDLKKLEIFPGPSLEISRFCLAEGAKNPEILRHLFAAIVKIVEQNDIKLIFGCTSFVGVDPRRYGGVFRHLSDNHLAPEKWQPGRLAAETYGLADASVITNPDGCGDLSAMPPLLRSYLTLGGWVSDHSVVDHEMGTLHVFTGVEVDKIPASRARALRALIAV